MFIRIFDIPAELRTGELVELIRGAVVERFRVPRDLVTVLFSSVPVFPRGAHGVLITGIQKAQMHRYRDIVRVVGNVCEEYFDAHGYLWYGIQNPQIASPKCET